MNKNRLKRIYDGMKQRCYNPNNPSARWYHDKGIMVCDEWLNSFDSFCKWSIQNGYDDDLTIDRIDPDNHYEPNNCRWITMEENRKRARQWRGGPRKGDSGELTVPPHIVNTYSLEQLDAGREFAEELRKIPQDIRYFVVALTKAYQSGVMDGVKIGRNDVKVTI